MTSTTSSTRPTGAPRVSRSVRRGLAATLVAVLGLVVLALPASAHVEAEGDTAASGITTVTLSFQHGCSPSPTISLKVELPDGTTEVEAQNPTGWTSNIAPHTITWTGGPIPDTTPGTFVASMRIVGNAGDIVFLPTIQGCVDGSNDWIEKTADAEADNAAPRITLTQTVAPATTVTTAASSATTKADTASTQGTTDSSAEAAANDAKIVEDSNNSPIGTIAIIIIVAIIAGGALVLYLRNRKPKPSAQ